MSRERRRRTIRAGIAAAASLISIAATASAVAAAPITPASAGPDGPSRSVTLATGDRVRVTPREGRVPLVTVDPGAGRDGVGFAVHATKDDIVVLPADAVPLIADGRLDRRLFDVDRLLASEYGDEAHGTSNRTPTASPEPQTSIVTFSATDRSGDPASHPIVLLSDMETGEYFVAEPQSDGTVLARVPAGTYNIAAQFEGGSNWTNGFQRIRELPAGATTVPLDARKNAPVEFTNDRSDAELTDATVTLDLMTDEHNTAMYLYGDARRKISVEANPDERLAYSAIATWQQKDADPSPYAFHDYRSTDDGVPADPSLHTRTADMARISMSIRDQGGAAGGTLRSYARTDTGETRWGEVSQPAPGTFTLYLRAGEELQWSNELRLYDKAGDELFSHFLTARSYKARRYSHVWNAAVLAPRPSTGSNQREGNELEVGVSCARTAAMNSSCGRGHTGTGTLTLSRDGTVLGQEEIGGSSWIDIEATVPAEPATYTVHESLTWPDLPPGSVTTAVDSVWTFRSAQTPQARGLPLMSVRYLPTGLDERNRAPGDRATIVPYWIGHDPGAAESRVKSVEIEASFDDGETWRRLRPIGLPALGVVRIDPPPGAGFVSLRATAEDADGNTVRQTVVRAYGLS